VTFQTKTRYTSTSWHAQKKRRNSQNKEKKWRVQRML